MSETAAENKSTESGSGCTFIKPRKIKGNLRKRTSESVISDDSDGSAVVRKQKTLAATPFVATTKTDDKKEDLTYKSTESATPYGAQDGGATFVNESDPVYEPKILAGDEAEMASAFEPKKEYKGLKGYTEWLDHKVESGLQKGTGIRAGPVRSTTTHIRISTRFDYQPDVCKDYKETGYCGFGDSCKFMHDRTDYKSGWELEKEWEEQQKRRFEKIEEKYEVEEDELDEFPFACSICRKPFTDPIVTKCKHYFCERCALERAKKTMKCEVCGENTLGAFSMVNPKIREKLDKKLQQARERGDYQSEDEDEEPPAHEGEGGEGEE